MMVVRYLFENLIVGADAGMKEMEDPHECSYMEAFTFGTNVNHTLGHADGTARTRPARMVLPSLLSILFYQFSSLSLSKFILNPDCRSPAPSHSRSG
jgi:hypothetical protein